jgi:hypothetical protein
MSGVGRSYSNGLELGHPNLSLESEFDLAKPLVCSPA